MSGVQGAMLLLAIACSAPDPAPAPVETAHAVFGEDRVHAASLVVADADWEALRTLAATRGSLQKTWFEAELEWDGEPVGRVGIRVKGQSKRLEAVGESIPLKVDFDRFTEGLRIHGLEGLALHSTPVDPTGIREALAYAAWREAGVPTARTGFVALTVNGRALGTYVSVESLDEHWLAATFPPGDGVLYEPVGTLGPPLTARAGEGFLKEGEDPGNARFGALLDALQGPVDGWGEVLDVDGLLALLAGDVALGNGDSFLRAGHNYLLYAPPDGPFRWIPWDEDRTWTREGLCPPVDPAKNPVWRGITTDPALEARYREAVRAMLAGPAHPDRLIAHADRLEALGVGDGPQIELLKAGIRGNSDRLVRALDAGQRCTN